MEHNENKKHIKIMLILELAKYTSGDLDEK